jgi:phage terminase small subunit
MPSKLGKKQALFVKEYLQDLNATQAAIRAGYSAKTAHDIGWENLRKPVIAAAIAVEMEKRSERLEISADRVVAELAKLSFANMLDYMRVGHGGNPTLDFSALTRDQAAALSEVTVEEYTDGHGEEALGVKRVKFKLADKLAALNSLGRHLGIFNDKLELTGKLTLEQLVMGAVAKRT